MIGIKIITNATATITEVLCVHLQINVSAVTGDAVVKKMFSTLSVLLLICSVVSYSLASNAGFRFRITSQGLNYASETLVHLLRQRLVETAIKDVNGEHGDFKYEIKNIKVGRFIVNVNIIFLFYVNIQT